ncbi:MAG TPA: tetratricopeptide repeat protein [Kofleriaceae bacterium]|jgi:tetratricopeptide (TPR) repeat protein
MSAKWKGWRPRVAIIALVTAVFLPTLWFTQSGVDDHWLWSEDSPLRHVDGDVLHHVFFELDARARHDVGTEYLPVRDVIVAADMAVWGDSYRGPHATQLLLYLISVVALGGLLVRWGVRADLAWVATALWAIHPLHVEPVAWLSERKGILAGLFVIALGHAWIRYRDGRSSRWLVAAIACAIAGTWSKAPAMFAPLVFAAWDYLVLPAHRRRWIATFATGAAALVAAIPVLIVARGGGIVDNDFKLAVDSRPVAAVSAFGHYVLGALGVREPSISYPLQTNGASAVEILVGVLALSGCIALAVAARARPSLTWRRAWVAWIAVWFIPISQLVFRVHIPVADRYVYLWLLAPCAGVAALLSLSRGLVRFAATLALIGLLSIQSIRALEAWTGGLSLFQRAVDRNPADAQMCESLARSKFMFTQYADALVVLDRCLTANPEQPYLLATQAMVLDAVGMHDEAVDAGARAAASGHASVMHDYAGMLLARGRLAEALPFAERAALRRPENPDYTWRQIQILVELKRFEEAEQVGFDLERRHPSSATEMVMARLYARWRRVPEMHAHLALAAALGAYRSAMRSVDESLTKHAEPPP